MIEEHPLPDVLTLLLRKSPLPPRALASPLSSSSPAMRTRQDKGHRRPPPLRPPRRAQPHDVRFARGMGRRLGPQRSHVRPGLGRHFQGLERARLRREVPEARRAVRANQHRPPLLRQERAARHWYEAVALGGGRLEVAPRRGISAGEIEREETVDLVDRRAPAGVSELLLHVAVPATLCSHAFSSCVFVRSTFTSGRNSTAPRRGTG